MADLQLKKTEIHKDVFEAKNVPAGQQNKSGRTSMTIQLRNAAKGESSTKVHQRGDRIFVTTSDAGRKALDEEVGQRTTKKTSIADLIAAAE